MPKESDGNEAWDVLFELVGAPSDPEARRRAVMAWRGGTAGMSPALLLAAARSWRGPYPSMREFLNHMSSMGRAERPAPGAARQQSLPDPRRLTKPEALDRIARMRGQLRAASDRKVPA